MSKVLAVVMISLGSIGIANADCILGFLGDCNPPVQAPEIDPASAISGLTLLAGCLVVLRGRKLGKK